MKQSVLKYVFDVEYPACRSRWKELLSDGAYPRRERRGIAPVQPITISQPDMNQY
jgi:hypothetical protein